jgi:hypothetical protein
MNFRSLQLMVGLFMPLIVMSLGGCFNPAISAEQINKARLEVAAAKDKQANIYAKEDFELAVRHCGRSEQAFWSGYNRKGYDLARMCQADADVAVWRSKLAIAEANQSRMKEEIEALERELAPFLPKEGMSREMTITREKVAQ